MISTKKLFHAFLADIEAKIGTKSWGRAGTFGNCCGADDSMDLSNKSNLWVWGMSLGLYSKSYQETKGNTEYTINGEMIHRFKYHVGLEQVERDAIVNNFTLQVSGAIVTELAAGYPHRQSPPFDVCLGPPENRDTGHSLPRNICRNLADKHDWIRDGFAGITKTRKGEVIKEFSHKERPSKLQGLYEIDRNRFPSPESGFLIIDDVFETGSTLEAMCNTLEIEFPKIPRFVVTLTHLHATERMSN